ncbi:MAG TPA: preQ(1) synthase [Kiritimatiellia bacterium]|nr:preQ(1) synthase [Kiritimatiellia bacterium]
MTRKTTKRSQPYPTLTQLGSGHKDYPNRPSQTILEVFPNPSPGRSYSILFSCAEFTSVCPVTGQPDFGQIDIRYTPGASCVESKSLKLYLGSFRNQGAFAEAIVNRILHDLVLALKPVKLEVTGVFTPRGGIGIEVTASYPDPA